MFVAEAAVILPRCDLTLVSGGMGDAVGIAVVAVRVVSIYGVFSGLGLG